MIQGLYQKLQELLERPLSAFPLREAICLEKHCSLLEGLDLFRKDKIGALLIVENRKLVGILTERDLLFRVGPYFSQMADSPIEQIMTSGVKSFTPKNTLAEVVELFSHFGFRHLPILDGDKLCVLSIRDILDFIFEEHRDFLEQFGNVIDWQGQSVRIESDDLFRNFIDDPGKEVFVTPLHYLTSEAYFIDENLPLNEVIKQMRENKVGIALIKKFETELAGIITERDFLKSYYGFENKIKTLQDLMTAKIHCLNEFHLIAHAINNMTQFGYRQVIVVNFDHVPVGVVSLLDILNFLLRKIVSFNERSNLGKK